MVSSLHTKFFIILTAACVVARACSFVSTSIISLSSSSLVKPFSASPPYKGACTLHQSSSPSSPKSRSYPSKKGYKKQQQTRNRGANQADHNRRGHEFRLNKENSYGRGDGAGGGGGGVKQRVRTTNTKRPPRWEREGDNLYQEVSKQHEHLQWLAKRRVSTVQDVCDVLAPWMTSNNNNDSGDDNHTEVQHQRNAKMEVHEQSLEAKEEEKTPPFLWGSLPVGPVIATRLRSSNRPSPTSVQCAAFTMLTATQSKNNKNVPTKRTNAIIASPTGTGKTLAYLLPLLCTSPGGQKGEGTGGVLIVTPTIELACQIQREVDILWPPSENESSSLFVVGANEMGACADDDDGEEEEEDVWSQGRIILRSIIGNKPLIAGTPKMLRMLYREAESIVKRPDDVYAFTKEERETSIALLSNLRAIVLDESDRLLRTEAVARETAERRQRKIDQQRRDEELAVDNDSRPPPPPKKKRLITARQTQTELLLRDLPVLSLDDIQIICASATIGRTMRRQLMQILGAPSADAAAALITGDEDARVKSKDAEKRKSVLLPEKLQHAFKVVDISDIGTGDEGGKDDEELSVAERNEERRIAATIRGMWDTMVTMEVAKPTIIFPGRVGVERVQEELKALGLQDVRTLRNLNGESHEANNDGAEDDVTETNNWKHVPVYIIGERFARGLDLPEVGNVILLTPPSSAAGYAHMAGRTGRSGREGTAITLVRPKNNEVQRLAAIAETLGLKFEQELSGVAGNQ